MSGFSSLTQGAFNGVNNTKGQSRILEAEMRMDASRGIVIPRKQEKLEMLKKQEETVMNYLVSAIEQDAENSKKFIDSVEETNNRIREEAEKAKEEKTAEESKEKIETKNNTDESQITSETGDIVDIVIPSTVVSTNAVTNKTDDSTVNVSA